MFEKRKVSNQLPEPSSLEIRKRRKIKHKEIAKEKEILKIAKDNRKQKNSKENVMKQNAKKAMKFINLQTDYEGKEVKKI